ncbi:unnamed protein product [Adineta steineri]|uniref:Dehydrogenase/reductase SDR family member 6 n=1 Tax=Adineta steineri TaxID=433720 RepID=A0A815N0C5_9BILA|nr:unnamed protein product [Adineta steineri]CAF1432300.1 unnamed protein product [Adineta steineri]
MTKQKKNRIYVIGLATAQQFADEGAYVFITGRRQEALDSAVKRIVIKEEKGKLDILFANTGVAGSMPLQSITKEFYDNIFNINVKGVLFTVQKALPPLNEGASIILNASFVSIKGTPGSSVYFASKAAVRSFARCFCVDLKERKIRVNAEVSKFIVDRLTSSTVLGRLGHPIEIAKAVVFLASDDNSYVTGIELFVDGGAGQI